MNLRSAQNRLFGRQFVKNSVYARGFLHPQPGLDGVRFEVLLQPLGASTADVQQNAIVLVDLAPLQGLKEAGGCDSAGGHDVNALLGFNQFLHCDGLFPLNHVGLTVGRLKDIVDRTDLAVGRAFVEQIVGIHLHLIFIGEVFGHKVVAPRLPGAVDGVMFHVLGHVLAWNGPLKQLGVDEALSHFVNADGTGSATDALEVMVGKTTDGVGRIDDQASDAVAASDVVNTAFICQPGS